MSSRADPTSTCKRAFLRTGDDLHAFMRELYPMPRSITGPGLRSTLAAIAELVPLSIHEVPTGTPVFDWVIPREWRIRSAFIARGDGSKVVSFGDSNLHVVGYSKPIDRIVSRGELQRHIHTLPWQPDLIPYRTAYYADTWGFCLPHAVWESLTDDEYRVYIDSDISAGSLSYGEFLIPGSSDEEMLISVHCCHPSLCNDNLSGIVTATALAQHLSKRKNRIGWRFLFLPATIGPIAWLARNQEKLASIKQGLVITCVGDGGPFHYKSTRSGGSRIDRIVRHVFETRQVPHKMLPFTPTGYDERQYASPGINLPVGCLMRAVHGQFPEYHTSADNLDYVQPEFLEESLNVLIDIAAALEADVVLKRTDGRGEPNLGRHGLYRSIGGRTADEEGHLALMWVLNLCDGDHSLLDIAERSGLPVQVIAEAASRASAAGLLVTEESG